MNIPTQAEQDIQDLLDSVATRLRNAYILNYNLMAPNTSRKLLDPAKKLPEFDGVRSKYGITKQSVWGILARKLFDRQRLDPEGFMKCQFQPRRPPTSGLLLSEIGWQEFIKETETATAQAEGGMRSDCVNFKVGVMDTQTWFPDMALNDVWKHVLQNMTLGMSMMFRYSVALSEGYEDLAQEFELGAVHEYLRSPEVYDQAWKHKLPQALKQKVQAIWNKSAVR